MTELFLIAHKVSGELAFDVATPLQIGEERGWIIPTSGHRAYPFWNIPLIRAVFDTQERGIYDLCPPMPPSIRDHYHSEAQAPVKQAGKIASLNLTDLGL